ncbi:putative ribonuclease H-like domain-containing protein, partial [Tanacetum coccineum]
MNPRRFQKHLKMKVLKSGLMLCKKNCCSSRYRKFRYLNKARLVAQGHRQEEGIDYDEVFAPVARIEAIRIFLAFASYMGFIVYQMDVKSSFLYGKIDEEERISKKRTKNKAKTTKPDTEWKSVEKTKSKQSPSLKKSTQVNPDKSKVK